MVQRIWFLGKEIKFHGTQSSMERWNMWNPNYLFIDEYAPSKTIVSPEANVQQCWQWHHLKYYLPLNATSRLQSLNSDCHLAIFLANNTCRVWWLNNFTHKVQYILLVCSYYNPVECHSMPTWYLLEDV